MEILVEQNNYTQKKKDYDYVGFAEGEDYAKKNLEYREKIIEKAENEVDKQGLLLSLSEDSFLFWVNTFGYTFNPRLEVQHLPFVTFPFQDDIALEIIHCIETGQDIHVDKSRDMGASWLVLAIFVWGWLFKSWDLRVGSRNRDYVDKGGDMSSLFEKLRYMIERLPSWMRPKEFSLKRGTKFNAAAKIVHPQRKNSIVGEATSPNFARGGRAKAILYDEFVFWQCAEDAWKGGADSTNCRIVISTPEGMGNKFADIKFDPDLLIKRFSLHWTLHPFKDEAWYEAEKARRTPQELAQEVDISYTASMSSVVYEQFNEVPIGRGPNFDYHPGLPLFRFWDFAEGGNDKTAIIWAQEDPDTKQVRVIDCYQLGNMDINYFGYLVTGLYDDEFYFDPEAKALMERQRHWKRAIDVGDPYNGNKTTFLNQTTIKKELGKHGIDMNLNRGCNNTMERIRIASLVLKRTLIHERCLGKGGFIQAMQNARWPQKSRGSNQTTPLTKPVHNETSHYRTAWEYGCEFLTGYKTKGTKKRIYRPQSGKNGYRDKYRKFLRNRR